MQCSNWSSNKYIQQRIQKWDDFTKTEEVEDGFELFKNLTTLLL
jgi:hypothetical protein